jgi:hypothetical protein
MAAELSIKQLRDKIYSGEAKDPLIFLEAVMSGQDLSQFSKIYKMILEIEEFTNGEPTKEDWQELVNFAFEHCKYKETTSAERQASAKTLMEYLHPKRKQIDLSDSTNADGNIAPISKEDIDCFIERYEEFVSL